MAERIRRSALDCDRFGIEVFRGLIEDEESAARAADLDRYERVDLLISRVRCDRLDLVRRLCTGRGFVTDTLVYYRGGTEGFEARAPAPGYEIRSASPGDAEPLARVSRSAFAGFAGHYHADPRLDSAAATEAYVDWSVSALSRPGCFTLLATAEGAIAGFILVREEGGEGEFVLNAVSPDHQGRGVYSSLVRAAGYRLKRGGCREVFSSTQLTNLGPQKVWGRNGLRLAESYYTFHHWFTPA